MGLKNGTLLWNRKLISLDAGVTDVDTGLCQVNKAFADMSPGEPNLGEAGVAAPAPGTGDVSRIQVIPMAPIAGWTDITHSEPWFSTVTGTVHVTFTNGGKTPALINVLFWDPHSINSPGEANHYNLELD